MPPKKLRLRKARLGNSIVFDLYLVGEAAAPSVSMAPLLAKGVKSTGCGGSQKTEFHVTALARLM
uniref:Uncharacterized protein n=1 Tax=Desulfomonile tiedjei TaxID=2358 RepID=A0A7C4EW32_9BACT